jgi:hypothetical protein
VPTLVLANRRDPIHPFEYGEALAQAIPGAEFKELTSKSVSRERHESEVQQFLEYFLDNAQKIVEHPRVKYVSLPAEIYSLDRERIKRDLNQA